VVEGGDGDGKKVKEGNDKLGGRLKRR